MGGLQETPGLGAAFLGGLLSFFSPCVLPLIPGYLSFMSGVSLSQLEGEGDEKARALFPVILASLAFIVGLGLVYMGLGVVAAVAATALKSGEGDWGGALATARPWLTRAGGAIVVILGIHMTGLFRIKALYQEKRLQPGKGGSTPRAFLLGVAFAFGWAPCTGPIIGSIWLYAATRPEPLTAFLLMGLYTLGLGLPIFLTGIGTRQFFRLFDRVKNHFRKIEIASGLLLIAVGLLMIFPPLLNYLKDLLMLILPDSAALWG